MRFILKEPDQSHNSCCLLSCFQTEQTRWWRHFWWILRRNDHINLQYMMIVILGTKSILFLAGNVIKWASHAIHAALYFKINYIVKGNMKGKYMSWNSPCHILSIMSHMLSIMNHILSIMSHMLSIMSHILSIMSHPEFYEGWCITVITQCLL